MTDKYFRAKVYAAGTGCIGIVEADTMPTLKRLASRKINGHHHGSHDILEVLEPDTDTVWFTMYRVNKVTPNNTCEYGSWI